MTTLRLPKAVAATLALGAIIGHAAPERSAPALIYVHEDTCGACMKFDQEVGGIYPKTEDGQRLPMVRISLDDWRSGDHDYDSCAVGAVHGTPTFIQLNDCKELDRITGYSSDVLFWLGVTRMQNRLQELQRD